MSPETDGEDAEGPSDFLFFFNSLFFTDSIKQRVDQRFWPERQCASWKQSRSPSVTTAMTDHLPPSIILTQICPVWNLINSRAAAGVCGRLWLLDPGSVSDHVPNSICIQHKDIHRDIHTLAGKTFKASEVIFQLKHRFIGLFSPPLLHFHPWPDCKNSSSHCSGSSGAPPSVWRYKVHLFVSTTPISGTKTAHTFTLIHCADYMPAISWSVLFSFFFKGEEEIDSWIVQLDTSALIKGKTST